MLKRVVNAARRVVAPDDFLALLNPLRSSRWKLVTTSGFGYAGPGRDDLDPQPRLEPKALLD
jgi:hypothetical protein